MDTSVILLSDDWKKSTSSSVTKNKKKKQKQLFAAAAARFLFLLFDYGKSFLHEGLLLPYVNRGLPLFQEEKGITRRLRSYE